jgi:outer membrane protein assembly factor BamE (lipoprotein component of BamABCDE complex)
MSRIVPAHKPRLPARPALMAAGLLCLTGLAGCNTVNVSDSLRMREEFINGYQVDQQVLDLVPVGSSREQVQLALGTPSTVNTIEGREAFYYISQLRSRPVAFAKPRLVSQRVMAVYFGQDGRVEQISDYGLQDGKLFDFVSRTTPTGGADASFLIGIIRGFSGGGTGAAPSPAALGI